MKTESTGLSLTGFMQYLGDHSLVAIVVVVMAVGVAWVIADHTN